MTVTVTADRPYQLMPDQAPDEYAGMKASIAADGLQYAVIVDEEGNVLDGHHRVRACLELGITDYPVIVRAGLTEAEKVALVVSLNMDRRHLDGAQRVALHVRLRAQGWSYRRIAAVTGVHHDTVREDVATVGNPTVALPDRSVGVDGISRPARIVRPQAEAAAERMAAIAGAVPARVEARADELPYDRVVVSDALAYLRGLPDGCANLCLSSPPYWRKRRYGEGDELGAEASPEAYLARLRGIIAEVGRVLAPTAWLALNLGDTYATQPGQYRGDPDRARGISAKAMAAAGSAPADRELDVPEKSLSVIPWRLLVALVTEDGWRCRNVVAWHKAGHQPENVHDRLTQAWEPVFLLTRARMPWFSRDTGDFLMPVDMWSIPVGRRGDGGDHPAVFPDRLVEKAIAHMCPPGGVVLDPFAGSGTVLDVAGRMGRRFLGCDLYPWGRGDAGETLDG